MTISKHQSFIKTLAFVSAFIGVESLSAQLHDEQENIRPAARNINALENQSQEFLEAAKNRHTIVKSANAILRGVPDLFGASWLISKESLLIRSISAAIDSVEDKKIIAAAAKGQVDILDKLVAGILAPLQVKDILKKENISQSLPFLRNKVQAIFASL